jgi:hypothetical protein
MIFDKAREFNDQLTWDEFNQGLGKQVNAEVCRWRARGWVAGGRRVDYRWVGPRELKKVIKS